MKAGNKKNPLAKIIGEQLSSVIFVMDYLQLDFNGPRLTCYVWPSVITGNGHYEYGNPEYRNKLCELISKSITEITLDNDVSLEIYFGEGQRLFLNLKYDNPNVKEVAFYTDSEGSWSSF